MTPTAQSHVTRMRDFRINLAIFLFVNVVLLVIGGGVVIAGYQLGGELWIYPLLMGLWALRVAYQGYRAYHEPQAR